jgi:hypothetical protein
MFTPKPQSIDWVWICLGRRKRMESNGTEAGSGPFTVSPAALSPAGHTLYTDEEARQLVAEFEEPFDPREIKWWVTNTTADKRRGQMFAYADPRAYTDRLNELFTVRGGLESACCASQRDDSGAGRRSRRQGRFPLLRPATVRTSATS